MRPTSSQSSGSLLIPEYLALVGDPSDGIPGFGPKSTAALIGRYGRLENVPSDPGEWEVEIRGVPIPDKLEDLEWRGASRDRVTSVVSAMDSHDLLERTIRYTD